MFALPIAWPGITNIDSHYLKKTSAHQLLSIRMQMGHPTDVAKTDIFTRPTRPVEDKQFLKPPCMVARPEVPQVIF